MLIPDSVSTYVRQKVTRKTCSRCKQTKDLDSFSPSKKGPMGRSSQCKKCQAKYAAEKAAKKKAADAAVEALKLTYPRIPNHMKQCKYCREIKVKEGNFRKRTDTKCGFEAKCNICFNKDRPSRAGSEYSRLHWQEYYAKNRRSILEKQKSDKSKAEYARKRYLQKRDDIKEKKKAYMQTPRAKALHAKNQSHRNRRLLKAQPKWLSKADMQAMQYVYWLAQDLKYTTGEVYHVDHIVPLRGKNVCGLHVPWNIQILPADVNRRKSNKMET